MCKSRSSAFTLIEMLIALAIFSVVSLTAGTLLYQATEARNVSTQYGNRMLDMERGMSRLGRDLLQYVPREIRDELGDYTLPLIITPSEIEFTRRGWANPAGHPRSELQRVRYAIENGALVRHYWDVLDRAPDSTSHSQVLFENVSWVNFEPITASQVLRGDFHVSVEDEAEPAIGIRVQMMVRGIGELTRIVDMSNEAPEESDEDQDDDDEENDAELDPDAPPKNEGDDSDA